ncbi:MAG TPA: hypothetical protein VN428_08375 [Bryobacteraceae bacterium]|nr:hypothetical protein [Bryobacteraceae bacterium]
MKPSGGKRPPVNKKPSGAPPRGGSAASASSRAPEQTFEEVRYIKYLIENEVPVRIRLRNDEVISGTIEYYDHSFIRVTRGKEPNLFIFKHDIKYLYEG